MSDPHASLAPGATIGILGGGQLGRMLSVAAARLGFKTCIFEPAGDCPASHVANVHFRADYDDEDALRAFAAAADVITFEFENIPAAAIDLLRGLAPVRPGRRALKASQDRLVEKAFLSGLGLATAPFAAVDDPEDLAEAISEIGTPGILKTRRFGYDGKGQARIDGPNDAGAALAAMNGAPAIYEGLVAFSREVSVIAARGLGGEVACYDPGENVHEGAAPPCPRAYRRRSAPTRRCWPGGSSTRSITRASWGWRSSSPRARSSSTKSRRVCTIPATGRRRAAPSTSSNSISARWPACRWAMAAATPMWRWKT
jgi:5-(carboxyamino)imidazole ribonucleotide synthase